MRTEPRVVARSRAPRRGRRLPVAPRARLGLGAALALGALGAVERAAAQTVLLHVPGAAGSRLGRAVCFCGDLDGDGLSEWAVGAPAFNQGTGRVTVYTGAGGAVLGTLDGNSPGDRFGQALCAGGDLDLDGQQELVVGVPGDARVIVYQGAPLAALYDLQGAPGSEFGASVDGGLDADGDGWPDLVVGAHGANGGSGEVRLVSGRTGGLQWTFDDPALTWLGHAVSLVGDVDGDGFADVLAGAPKSNWDAIGATRVLNGVSASVIRSQDPNWPPGDELGWSTARLSDLDGDGVDDYAIGARAYGRLHWWDDPHVEVRSGATGGLLWSVEGPADSWFADALSRAGDVDLDGVEDLLVGNSAAFQPDSYVEWLSGVDGASLGTFDGASQAVGDAVAGGVDVDGDGFPDHLTGHGGFSSSNPLPGQAWLLTLGCWPDAVASVCVTSPNTVGPGATLFHQNSTSVAQNDLRLNAVGCPPNEFGLFFYGPSEVQFPAGNGFLCVGAPQYRLPAVPTGTGAASWLLDLTQPPLPGGQVTAGSTWVFQFWYRDPSAPGATYNFSDALRVTFCP